MSTIEHKPLDKQVREVVYNSFNYITRIFAGESKTQIKQRVGECTGVSIRSIERIVNEATTSAAQNQGTPVFRSPKKSRKPFTVTNVQDYECADIRSMIYNFHATEKSVVTLSRLQEKLEKEYDWKGSRASLHKVVKKLGFKWLKTKDNRKLVIEKNRIKLLRVNYLEKIKYYRQQGRPIVFLDETYIHESHTTPKSWTDDTSQGLLAPISKGRRLIIVHAGGAMGFIPNSLLIFQSGTKSGDYHAEMNADNFQKWITTQLIPNLPEQSVIICDNASYHNIQEDRPPTSNSKKNDMIEWLSKRNIAFTPAMYRPQLYDIIKRHKEHHRNYKFDRLFEERGHTVLRLPPYHPDLNAIEKVWGLVKNRVAQRNITYKLADVRMLAEEEFSRVTVDVWQNTCRNVIEKENMYLEREKALDLHIEPLIISTNDDSSSESDDEYYNDSD